MLQSLRVKNLALIKEIEVDFTDGLNILTGETGAGKSIILGSINLALGGRYTGDIIRDGAEFAYVELNFFIEDEGIIQALCELDIPLEDGLIILSRKLMNGRSVSRINGQSVTQACLKEVAALLIDIHGQHEHQSLLNSKNHMEILDDYIGKECLQLRREVECNYKSYKNAIAEMEKATIDSESRAREISFLEFETTEIINSNLIEEEDIELESSYKKMLNSKKIHENVQISHNFCTGDENNASELLTRAIQYMQMATGYDEKCDELFNQLSEIDNLLNDFTRELSSYIGELEFSEEEFLEVETRLNQWNHLKSKYGNSYSEIMKYLHECNEKLEKLNDYDSYIEKLKLEVHSMEKSLFVSANKLSDLRKKHGITFDKLVITSLKELNFLDIQFKTQIISSNDTLNQNGIDNIEFHVSLNPGQSIKPLSNVVSGGELSRIMLVIKEVLADKDEIGTIIFDEVDAGISGITASKVGEKLKAIGNHRQVICITHLAQIAALSDKHFIIEKNNIKGDTTTQINELDYDESIMELARILGGDQISDTMIKSAKELKK